MHINIHWHIRFRFQKKSFLKNQPPKEMLWLNCLVFPIFLCASCSYLTYLREDYLNVSQKASKHRQKNQMVSTSLNLEMKVKYCFCVLIMYKLTITEHILPKYYHAFLVMTMENVPSNSEIFQCLCKSKFPDSGSYFRGKTNNFN